MTRPKFAYVVVTPTGLAYGVWRGPAALQLAEAWARTHLPTAWQVLPLSELPKVQK